MRTKVFSLVLFIILIAFVLAVGCAKTAPATTTAPTTAAATTTAPATTAAPQRGGVLTILMPAGPSNAGVYPGVPVAGSGMAFGRLFGETLLMWDEHAQLAPKLATAWQISPDYTSVTLTLRKGVKFSDGTDFNAAAVKYNVDFTKQVSPTTFTYISSVDVLDDYTVRINVPKWDIQVMTSFLPTTSGMTSPTALKTQTKEWLLANPVGTGPFKLVSFQRDVSAKAERRDDYWQPGKPYLDDIVFNFVADKFTELAAFKAGQAQIMTDPSLKDASDLKSQGYVVTKVPAYAAALTGDSRNPNSPFANIKVRQAISYAINRDALVKGLGYGIYTATLQPGDPLDYWYNPNIIGYPYNLDKAKALLAEAGYPNGFKTVMTIPTEESGDYWVQVQSDLKQVGIDADVQNMDSAAWNKLHQTGWTNSLTFIRAFFLAPEGDEGAMIQNALGNKSINYVSVDDPADFQAKLDQINTTKDMEQRKALVRELMKIVIDNDCMAIPIFEKYSVAVRTSQVHDAKLLDTWTSQWAPQDAWLSK